MAHASMRRLELSRGGPATPTALSNIMVTAVYAAALAALFATYWLWAAR
jgi:hypothetical protein